MSDNMRASFEKWAETDDGNCNSFDLRTVHGEYVNSEIERDYLVWGAAYNMQQAVIDRLMLEFCPDEMTEEQMETWAKHQRRVEE